MAFMGLMVFTDVMAFMDVMALWMGTGGCRYGGCTRLRLADCLSDLSNLMDALAFMIGMFLRMHWLL
jgi:hypothetical protein